MICNDKWNFYENKSNTAIKVEDIDEILYSEVLKSLQ